MAEIYEYTYFSQQKTALAENLRLAVNKTLTNMRMGMMNTPKKVAGGGQALVKNTVRSTAAYDVWECRIDGHWRIFYFTNPGGNITVLCIGHLDPSGRLDRP